MRSCFFFFQAEDGIRDYDVTGVQTCALPIFAVTISFEAIPGGGMEDVEAVGNLRAATVVFRLDGPEWEVDGKAYFNLSPAQTIDYYHNELETVD